MLFGSLRKTDGPATWHPSHQHGCGKFRWRRRGRDDCPQSVFVASMAAGVYGEEWHVLRGVVLLMRILPVVRTAAP